MEPGQKKARYARVAEQLKELFGATRDPEARMATAAALLHAKLPGFLWTVASSSGTGLPNCCTASASPRRSA